MLKSWRHCLTVSVLLFWPVVQSEEQSIDLTGLTDLTQAQTPIIAGVDQLGQPQVVDDIGNESGGTKITLSDKPSHKIPKLYGMMYEDINHSGDGGLYAELLRNRALQAKDPTKNQAGALEAWSAVNGIKLKAVDLSKSLPLSKAIPNALEITVKAGIKIDKDWDYTASFYARMSKKGDVSCGPEMSIHLSSKSKSSDAFADERVKTPCLNEKWQKFKVKLRPSRSAKSANNVFSIKFKSTSKKDEVVYIALASLFPPTFKNRKNGVRVDLAEATAELKRSFFRWGGNNIEGYSAQNRWLWFQTIGPLTDRPGRKGNWGYVNTDGFGLFEVLQFCEDLKMEFIGSVWAGLSLSPFKSVPEKEIDKYIQEAIDMGPESTKQGALRAKLGHPAPFKMRYVEIGNEDFFDEKTYGYRWKHLVPPLMKAFPHLKFIATTLPHKPELSPLPAGWDIHTYREPKGYSGKTQEYDSYSREEPKIFQLEFAANGPKLGQGPISPTLEGALSEAAYMTGFERSIAYAPTYCNVQTREASQWRSQGHKDTFIPCSTDGEVFWSATVDSSDSRIFLKLVNISPKTEHKFSVEIPYTAASKSTVFTLRASKNSETPPRKSSLTIKAEKRLSYTLPPQTFAVIIIEKAS
ncbi:family 51 glycoside hydrolase [Melampsora larici-populina 98AG31]|uniref:non-reducing end alpha-L-arabinofuranosidase n=1 Tax=Melampsora larici-populina (strain 98AG31 / pathotype 3-4-7) TaxID=747676 RepID=F4RNW6_MELLP|nr:family 51 glycoside hydrolase [Melampsora larici-populina 98AG31]EGG05819.1 family 51 glycoside hydrolase [Melampsora larici-populina 98AG31]